MQKPYPDCGYPVMGVYMPPVPVMPICPILARAYVPYQVYQQSFDLNEALGKGTLYPELFQPYMKRVIPFLREENKDES